MSVATRQKYPLFVEALDCVGYCTDSSSAPSLHSALACFPLEIFHCQVAEHSDDEKRREDVEFDGGTEIEAVGERHDETQRLPQTIVGKRRLRLAAEQRAV